MLEKLKQHIDAARAGSLTFLDFYRQLQRRGVAIVVVSAHPEHAVSNAPKITYYFEDGVYPESHLGEIYSYAVLMEIFASHSKATSDSLKSSQEQLRMTAH